MPRFGTALQGARHPTRRGGVTVPRHTPITALVMPGERTGVATELGDRGFFKASLPEAANKAYPALDSGGQRLDFKSIQLITFFGIAAGLSILEVKSSSSNQRSLIILLLR